MRSRMLPAMVGLVLMSFITLRLVAETTIVKPAGVGLSTERLSRITDIESKKPMSKDAVFRIASMTGPVVGVAVR